MMKNLKFFSGRNQQAEEAEELRQATGLWIVADTTIYHQDQPEAESNQEQTFQGEILKMDVFVRSKWKNQEHGKK